MLIVRGYFNPSSIEKQIKIIENNGSKEIRVIEQNYSNITILTNITIPEILKFYRFSNPDFNQHGYFRH